MNVMYCIVSCKLIDRSEEPTAFIFTVDGWKKYVYWIVGKFLRLHGVSSQKTVFLIAATIQTSSLITLMFYTSQSSMALGLTQPLSEMSTRNISWG